MRRFVDKVLKFLILCFVVYLLLFGASYVINVLNHLLERPAEEYAFQHEGIIKYPLFAIVAYLVYSEKI